MIVYTGEGQAIFDEASFPEKSRQAWIYATPDGWTVSLEEGGHFRDLFEDIDSLKWAKDAADEWVSRGVVPSPLTNNGPEAPSAGFRPGASRRGRFPLRAVRLVRKEAEC